MRLRKENTLLEDEILLISSVSDALAHPARVKLYQYIMECNKDSKEVCNGDLVEAFDYSQATISQHMKKLCQAGLIETKKKEKYTYYFANVGKLMMYLNATKKFNSFTR